MKPALMLLGCIWLLGTAAQAQKAPAANPRQACQADVKRFCADVRPGRGRMRACLMAHKDQLSAACRDALPKPVPKHLMPKPQPSPSST